MIIVTNTTGIGSYTPSRFNNEDEALKWFYDLSRRNIEAAYDEELIEHFGNDLSVISDKEIVEYAAESIYIDVELSADKRCTINYGDGTFNDIEVFRE